MYQRSCYRWHRGRARWLSASVDARYWDVPGPRCSMSSDISVPFLFTCYLSERGIFFTRTRNHTHCTHSRSWPLVVCGVGRVGWGDGRLARTRRHSGRRWARAAASVKEPTRAGVTKLPIWAMYVGIRLASLQLPLTPSPSISLSSPLALRLASGLTEPDHHLLSPLT